MNNHPAQLLTRKDISAATGHSVWTVMMKEKRLGLLPFKVVVNCRVIRYRPEVLGMLTTGSPPRTANSPQSRTPAQMPCNVTTGTQRTARGILAARCEGTTAHQRTR